MKSTFYLLCFILAVFQGQASYSQSTVDSLSSQVIEPIKLTEINYEIERVEKSFQKMETLKLPDNRILAIEASFSEYKNFLEKEANEFRTFNPYNLSKYFLENSYRLWEGFYQKLTGWQTEVNGRLKSVQDNIDQLEKTKKIWELTLKNEAYLGESDELGTRIRIISEKADEYSQSLGKQKWEYIKLEDEITGMITYCNELIANITQLQQNQRDSLFIAVSPPLWKVKVTQADYLPLDSKLQRAAHENKKTLKNYFQTQSLKPFWIFSFVIVLLFFLLRHSYLRKNFDDSRAGHKRILRIFVNHPFLTITSLILVFFHLLYPFYPLSLNHILTLVLLVNMRFILSDFIDKDDRQFIYKLIVLLALNDLEVVLWYFGDVARYYVQFETILGILLTVNYLKPIYWKQYRSEKLLKKVKWLLALFVTSFYLIAFVSNLYGYLDLAVLIAKVGIHVPEFTVVLYGIYLIITTLIRAVVSIGSSRSKNLTESYWPGIERRAIQISGILAVVYWMYSFTVSFEVSRVFYESIVDFLVAERSIGTLQITIGSIFALILILLVTFIITGVLKAMIEPVFLKRVKLPRGIPAAISVTIRYFLIILGFMFALSIAGIDLGKFSLLAGALGVGIGFGLQNIVNNFISGLVLVYERPLQVGDTIEVENLLGQVSRIGIRSSNVRTYDGAEVVVPNGNLISNQLINWTLSDNKRRIEIKVGVSYGSDPNIVLSLLEKVAINHEDVMPEPPPIALFENFGDSSLNFRLLFWVPYDIGIRTKSAVAIGIFNIFRENGIEIPFPQVDLHLKKEGEKISEEEIKAIELRTKGASGSPSAEGV